MDTVFKWFALVVVVIMATSMVGISDDDTIKRVSDLEQRVSDLETENALLKTTPRD